MSNVTRLYLDLEDLQRLHNAMTATKLDPVIIRNGMEDWEEHEQLSKRLEVAMYRINFP